MMEGSFPIVSLGSLTFPIKALVSRLLDSIFLFSELRVVISLPIKISSIRYNRNYSTVFSIASLIFSFLNNGLF